MAPEELRDLVGYQQRLQKMPYRELRAEAKRVGAETFEGIIRPILIMRIMEKQGLSDNNLKGE